MDSVPSSLADLKHLVQPYSPHIEPAYVYFLLRGDEVVYVGSTIELSRRIKAHQREACKVFDRVFVIETTRRQVRSLESDMIHKFNPKYNERDSESKGRRRLNADDEPACGTVYSRESRRLAKIESIANTPEMRRIHG